MKIENINIGICHSRVQQNKQAIFVCWEQNRERKYFFSHIRSIVEDVKNKLERFCKNE